METRTIQQVKVFSLHLNSIYANYEASTMVAYAYSEQALPDWVESHKGEPYQDGRFTKVFQKGSPLENFNPPEMAEHTGIDITWTTQESINGYIENAEKSFGFIHVPELVV